MKLNYKKTIFVGFAFFLICTFWQAYDSIIPKILTDKFGMSQTWSGFIMAIDNILALFMLPLFGAISDRNKSRYGRRTPFIVIGTIAATVAFLALSFADGMQLSNISDVSDTESERSLEILYTYNYEDIIKTPEGEEFSVSDVFTADEFGEIRPGSFGVRYADGTADVYADKAEAENAAAAAGGELIAPYTEYCVPLRQAYAWQMTRENPATLVFFMALLLIALISMATFRSPAVALMPDVTIKPLRSKANAVINLMGSFGGIIVLILGILFGTGKSVNALMSYTTYFVTVGAIMITALIIFVATVREPRLVDEMTRDSKKYGIDDSGDGDIGDVGAAGGEHKLTRPEFRSLILILTSVVLWFFGYNAVTSKYSVYAGEVLALDFNMTLIIAQAAAILAYIPVGIISSRFGRKKTILAGIVMLAAAFTTASFMREGSSAVIMNCMFALAGIGWATINVNSFPMVVELSRNSDVGKYTGFYYTASMAAQTVTPILSGMLLDIKMTTLFPYATVFVVLAFVTMLFVRHGDAKEIKR